MKITIRKTGSASHPWRALCSVCSHRRTDCLHFTDSGVVVINSAFSFLGNRTHSLAVLAADHHIRAHEIDKDLG